MVIDSIQQINLTHSNVFIREDGIVQINSSDLTYGVEEIKEIHKAVHQLSKPKKALLLLIASDYTIIDIDAKKFLSTEEAGQYSIAEAYVIKSLAQRLLLNFLIKIKGTPVPVQFFSEVDLAVEWLNKYKIS